MTHEPGMAAGELAATLAVTEPDHSVHMSQNFFADKDLQPVVYVPLESIPVQAAGPGEYAVTIELDGGAAHTRTFRFSPTRHQSEPGDPSAAVDRAAHRRTAVSRAV